MSAPAPTRAKWRTSRAQPLDMQRLGGNARKERLRSLDSQRGIRTHSLPVWPVTAPFPAYILWWALGVGDMIWIICAIFAVMSWAGTRGLKIPPLGVVWLLFLVWVAASISMVDTTGRLIGATYRLTLYTAAGILALHAYNLRSRLSARTILATLTLFLVSVIIGGYLALAAPELVIHTPMSYVLPDSLLSNDLVNEMVIRRTTQWNPNAWIVQAPRPAAPFLYANTWGNVYSLLLPLSLVHARLEYRLGSVWRWPVIAVCIVSAPVAALTLNRGMFIGLAAVAVWVGFQMLRAGRWVTVLGGAMSVLLVVSVWLVSPAGAQLSERLETSHSTEDRSILYWATIEAVAKSPLLGFGGPRPAQHDWLPSLGTQGQLWTVLFSHGVVGLILFFTFFLGALAFALHRTDLLGAVLGGIILATLVETVFYGMMTGLMISLLAVFFLLRGDTLPVTDDRTRRLRTGERYNQWEKNTLHSADSAYKHTPGWPRSRKKERDERRATHLALDAVAEQHMRLNGGEGGDGGS